MAKLNGKTVLFSPTVAPVDQEYNPTSANAQSGTAVAEAVEKTFGLTKRYTGNPCELSIEDDTILDNIIAEFAEQEQFNHVDINTIGKNLVNPNNIYHVEIASPKTWVNQPNNNVIWLPIENGKTYTIKQTVFTSKARYALVDTVSNTERVDCYQPPYVTDTSEIAGFKNLLTSHTTETFVNKFNRKYLVAWVHTNTDTVPLEDVLGSIQVEEGSTATEYEPYKGMTYTINIGQNVTSGKLNTKIGKFTFDGTDIEVTVPTIELPTGNIKLSIQNASVLNVDLSIPLKNYIDEQIADKVSNSLYGKKIIAIGDSMVYGHTLPSSATWLSLIAERNNMTFVNYGINGGTMTHRINPNTGNADGVVDRYSTMDSDADFVIVFAGTNDCDQNITLGNEGSTNTSEFYGALNNITDGLQAKYPTAKIAFFTPYARSGIKARCKQYRDAICTACERGGIPVFDNIKNGGINWDVTAQLNAYTLKDTYHLNANGMIMASKKYENFLKTI